MRNFLKLLTAGLLGVSLVACTTYAATNARWSGNPKFTTGLSAPSVTGVDAAAREASDRKPR